MVNYTKFFSEVALARRPSPIRVLTAIQAQAGPEMISLAGGQPNPALFPITALSFVANNQSYSLSPKMVAKGLQYAPSKGIPEFTKCIVDMRHRYHGKTEHESRIDQCVSVGSQNGLEMLLTSLVNRGDGILLDEPCYPGTKAILGPLGAEMIGVETDGDGMDVKDLIRKINQAKDKGITLKAIMTVSNGGNPNGASLSLERRLRLLDVAEHYDLLIIEDDPYYFLQFEPPVESIFSLDWQQGLGRTIRSDSLSKVISAGIRIGWLTGPNEVIEKVELATQASTLHCPALVQAICAELLTAWGDDGFAAHVDSVQTFYASQRNAMLEAAERHLTGLAEWECPQAGMFVWFKLHGIEDTQVLIEQKARDANVLLVPGVCFSTSGTASPHVRAAYSLPTPDEMDEGLKRLAQLIREHTGQS